MRHAISALCCFIVCLQILIGVPLVVCAAYFFVMDGSAGPLTVEVHSGRGELPHVVVPGATIPPPNIIPSTSNAAFDNPILQSRAAVGSPLTGTMLGDSTPPQLEQEMFVAEFEKVAAERHLQQAHTETVPRNNAVASLESNSPNQQADQFIVQRLYEMADRDERAGNFDRADQWRALARGFRQADNAVSMPAADAAAECPAAAELPPEIAANPRAESPSAN